MPQEAPQREWLVIALVYNHQYYDELYYATFPNDNTYINMEHQTGNLFHAFREIAYSDSIKVLLVENRLKFGGTAQQLVLNSALTVTEKVAAPPEQPLHRERGQLIPFSLTHITKPDTLLTTGDTLGNFLKILTDYFPARRHMLITYGHGSILGINLAMSLHSLQPGSGGKPQDADKTLKQNNDPGTEMLKDILLNTSSLPKAEKVNTLLAVAANPQGPANGNQHFFTPEDFEALQKAAGCHAVLTNAELNTAIEKAFPDKGEEVQRLDMLVMFNCLMQNLYTQYELRENVQYLVAPETGICYPGYNWRGVFDKLNQQSDMPGDTLAALFTTSIRDPTSTKYYNDYYLTHIDDIESTWKVVSMRLDKTALEVVKKKFTSLMEALNKASQASNRISNYISTALAQCFNYTIDCLGNKERLIDLHSFCTELAKLAQDGSEPAQTLITPALQLAQSLESLTGCGSLVANHLFDGKYFFIDKEDTESQKRSSGFLLQKHLYPPGTVMNDMLSKANKEFFPAFLDNTGFTEFYETYVPAAKGKEST